MNDKSVTVLLVEDNPSDRLVRSTGRQSAETTSPVECIRPTDGLYGKGIRVTR